MENSFLNIYKQSSVVRQIAEKLNKEKNVRIGLQGLLGSSYAVLAAAVATQDDYSHFIVLNDKESAAYFFNDLENLLGEQGLDFTQKNILFFPVSYKRPYEVDEINNANVLLRSEVLTRLNAGKKTMVVTYPEALSEKVISQTVLSKNTLSLQVGKGVSMDFVTDVLIEYGFNHADVTIEPGEFSVRGGIVDVFSFSNDYPFRMEFYGDEIESLRTFDPENQLSREHLSEITIIPDIRNEEIIQQRTSIFSYLGSRAVVWLENPDLVTDCLDHEFEKMQKAYDSLDKTVVKRSTPDELFINASAFLKEITSMHCIEIGSKSLFKESEIFLFNISLQPVFNKNFDILIENLASYGEKGYKNIIFSENIKQTQRLQTIIQEIGEHKETLPPLALYCPEFEKFALQNGFIDHDLKIACYTDHQIFERYHRYRINDAQQTKEALTIKDLYNIKPGDYITHIDHGIGRFGGLEKIEVNGKIQESIRLIYKENDVLYISIHSLHRISRYTGKEGIAPTLHRLGSNTWSNLKNKAKQRVKDIAKDLIKLYAQRKASKGFGFSADNYLQNELEASFFYEDTPDQLKATHDIKQDMQADFPMDRLICGDVGFGKTELAVRAAFKAVCDSKQVAILVPTTVLALQHYKTFSDRLANLPCKVAYINRFRSGKEKKEIVKELAEGKIDILIGTHRIVSGDVKFKDLGLLIVDEEQKFGVAIKEKLKQMKVNVDTLTLTATPIPRTLQFSLMGARDLSILRTPPANRYPVQTEIHSFSEDLIVEVIGRELSRGGQVFFVHNRVQNINEIAGIIQRLIPDARIAIGHGQMDGDKLETVLMDFIEGEYDVLVATTIVENGLDIPNANTIIINDAHHYGLSELHQLRGRVGRSNKKAFCYLLSPPLSVLTDEARKRLRAIEEFAEIGSGFNIAMRDLDIRGAGNILGAEQSGFISDIGFDIYQKILNEAMEELKETEFSDLYEEEIKNKSYIKDCTIETDLEILIPDGYVSNIVERMALYKELDGLQTDEELEKYKSVLTDRFGKLPMQTEELIRAVKLRELAKMIGFERLILKQNRLTAYFISDPESTYFQSEQFGNIIEYLKNNPIRCAMKENKGKLSFTIDKIPTISEAIACLSRLG